MAEITNAGYQSLRDFVNSDSVTPNSWDYIALYDDSQSEILRASVSSDSRASWTDVDGDALIAATITISGSDGDVPLGTTFEYSALFDDTAGNSGRQVTQIEQHLDTAIYESGDDMTVVHEVTFPT